ncbi:MAG: sodium:calcium antiporter, partial [Angustibacter sp.]
LAVQAQRAVPATWAIVVQTLGSLVTVFVACRVFVAQLEWAGPQLGLPTTVVALLLAPIATELPEVLNAVIWVRKGRAQLALSNICGSMMIQATVPSAVGLWMTPWYFSAPLRWAGLATLITVAALYGLLRTGRLTPTSLAMAALGYLIFAVPLLLTG